MSRKLFVLLVGAVAAFPGDITGLRQQSEIKITSQMAGAPFDGEDPPFIWAISFSPDGNELAFGVQFARKKDHRFYSYLLVVSAARPGVVLKKFETPSQVQLTNLCTMVWSPDSRSLVVTPYGDWEHAGVLDLIAGQLHVVEDRIGVPWCGHAVGLLPGARIVQNCSLPNGQGNVVRFLTIDGTVTAHWSFPSVIGLLGVSPDTKMLAVDFIDAVLPGGVHRRPHEVGIFNTDDRTEVRRLRLPEADAYGGTFASSGKAFCTVPTPNRVDIIHMVQCHDIATDQLTSGFALPKGPIYSIGGAANNLVFRHAGAVTLPFQMFGTNYVLSREDWYLSDVQAGKGIAHWRADWQGILPKFESTLESAVSSTGDRVAIGESGIIKLYRVSP